MAPELVIRPWHEGDLLPVLAVANHPDVRRWSFSPGPIGLAEHDAWFRHVLADPDRILLLAELGEPNGQRPVAGYVRISPDREVSIAVAPAWQGHGIGSRLLKSAAAQARARSWQSLIARVDAGNRSSIRIFEQAGYVLDGSSDADGKQWLRYRLDLLPAPSADPTPHAG